MVNNVTNTPSVYSSTPAPSGSTSGTGGPAEFRPDIASVNDMLTENIVMIMQQGQGMMKTFANATKAEEATARRNAKEDEHEEAVAHAKARKEEPPQKSIFDEGAL